MREARLCLQVDIENLAFSPRGSWHKWMPSSSSARWHEYFVVHSRSLRSLLAGMHCTVARMHDVRRRKCFQDPDRNCNAHTHRKMRLTSQTGQLISTTADWKIALSKNVKPRLRASSSKTCEKAPILDEPHFTNSFPEHTHSGQ